MDSVTKTTNAFKVYVFILGTGGLLSIQINGLLAVMHGTIIVVSADINDTLMDHIYSVIILYVFYYIFMLKY